MITRTIKNYLTLYKVLATTISNNSRRSFHYSSTHLGVIKPFLLADIGEGITECEIIQWFIKPGQNVQEFDKICEVQSDKASVEISSRYSGSIIKLHYGQNDIAKVGDPLVDIETDEEGAINSTDDNTKESSTIAATLPEIKTTTASSFYSTWKTPAVRRLLSEYNLNTSDIVGSGKNNRMLKEDVLRFINDNALSKSDLTKSQLSPSKISNHEHAVPLTAIQKVMFKTMTQSLAIPQLGYKDEVELNAASEYRAALNKYIASKSNQYSFHKISYMPIFIKSLSLSLSYHPIMNAQINTTDDNLKIIYRDAHNIGIAMDTPHGLIVPNIKNVQNKTILEVAAEIHHLTELAKKGTIPLSDLRGGTITLSNIGSIGGTYANPIIASPSELVIVAIGSAKRLPRFSLSGSLMAKQILPVSWSADHRVVDGATIAQFGNTWKSFIENPALLASKLY